MNQEHLIGWHAIGRLSLRRAWPRASEATHARRRLRYPALWVLVICLTGTGLHAEEVRGTLKEPVRKPHMVIVDDRGQEHKFDVSRASYRSGIGGRSETNETHLPLRCPLVVEHENGVASVVTLDWQWYEFPALWLEERIDGFEHWSKDQLGPDSVFSKRWMVLGLLGVTLVSLTCGMVSSLIVSNRMAFFSDAVAHCAFAGIALGLVLFLLGIVSDDGILGIMILFGVLVGLGIAYVRERTGLANDTVIGVFFAASMGLGAVLLKGVRGAPSRYSSPENFLFGDLLGVNGKDLVYLALLLGACAAFLYWFYNSLVFTSFNPSLARSRGFSIRLGNYLFIILLGLIVNICLKVVGALLINALLILPAAAAANVARNLRQFFWISTLLSLIAGVTGLLLSDWWSPVLGGRTIHLGSGGLIVLVGVMFFFASMFLGRWVRGARPSLRPGL